MLEATQETLYLHFLCDRKKHTDEPDGRLTTELKQPHPAYLKFLTEKEGNQGDEIQWATWWKVGSREERKKKISQEMFRKSGKTGK